MPVMPPDGTSYTLVKRPRRVTPRVRTGCITCKARRVKCDEEKPSCLRCTSTGRKCEGYIKGKNHDYFSVMVVQSLHSPQQGPSTLHVSGENVQYLEFYHHCASRRIANDFDQSFWNLTTLRMAHTEPCIRNALIAIGSLSKTTTGSLKDAASSFRNVTKHRTPLLHYNKAVNLLSRRMSESSYTPEIGLIACLLFICIEFLRGNNSMALIHFTSGLKMIAASRKLQRHDSESKHTNEIEDTLAPIFIRMLATPLMYGVPTDLVTDRPPTPPSQPFTSMLEAQSSLHKIRNTAMLFAHDLLPKVAANPLLSQEDLQTRDTVLSLHTSWFQSLLAYEETTPLTPSQRATSHSLKASHYCTSIFISSLTQGTQMAFDAHLPTFKLLLHHAEQFLNHISTHQPPNSPGANFTFDTTIIPYLVHTATYCRCPTTRRQAISLLSRNPPREGLCDAAQNVVVLKRVVEIEEAEVDPWTGWPVERTRIWFVNIRDDMDGGGRFSANFAVGLWGEGKGLPVVPFGVVLERGERDRFWREEFVV